MAMEGNDSNFHTESAEFIIQIKSMIDTGTSQVKVENQYYSIFKTWVSLV